MLISFPALLIMLGILILPGSLIVYLARQHLKSLTGLDRFLAGLLLSGLWNFLFFLPRLLPDKRVGIYLIGLAILMIASVISYAKNRREKIDLKNILKGAKNIFKSAKVPLLVIILGIILVGYPFHKLNLSRLQPSQGGDVEFFLYKTQLLKAGYSFLDDPYADQINFYPNFLTAEVALSTLLNGNKNIVGQAETFRLVIVVLFFWLFYALGKSLKLKDSQAVFMSLVSLPGYSIWGHLTVYVMAGMAFYASLMFFYFFMRAFYGGGKSLWLLAGLAAGLVIHSHPVHAVFAFFYSVTAILVYIVYAKNKQSKNLKEIANELGLFILGPIIIGGLYILPLIIKYKLKVTSDFHVTEPFKNDIQVFWDKLLDIRAFGIAVGISIVGGVYYYWQKKRHKSAPAIKELSPLINLYLTIFGLATIISIFAVKTHRLAIYVDTDDFFHIAKVLAWTLVAFSVVSLTQIYLLRGLYKNEKIKNFIKTLTNWAPAVLFTLIILPFSPFFYDKDPAFFSQYAIGIWKYTDLTEPDGQRATEGNLNEPEYDQLAKEVQSVLPIDKTSLLMTPSVTHSFGSHFGRRLIYYDAYAHSNIFLTPPFKERLNDVSVLYKDFNHEKLQAMIKKYKITHIFWTWLDSPSMLKTLNQEKNLKQIYAHQWRGFLFEVKNSN